MYSNPKLNFPIHILPGGKMPERQTDGAAGYDLSIRAVVSSHDMDPENPHLRKTLFDFETFPDDPDVSQFVQKNDETGKFTYRLDPDKAVLVGIGFIIAIDPHYLLSIDPRSGLATKHGIEVRNSPGTVDSDYRGEAGVLLINKSSTPFFLEYGMRIAQGKFFRVEFPTLNPVGNPEDLSETKRGSGGFGSTGGFGPTDESG